MWILLSLASALFSALRNAALKRLGHALDEYIAVWGRFAFVVPFALLPCLLRGWATLKPGFFPWCLAFGVSQSLATLALSKALKLSEFSLVTPLWKVSLLGVLMMGYALGEHPTGLGISGVLLSTVGVYLLNVSRARISVWEPIRVLVTDRGQRYTLLAAFLFGPAVLTFKQVVLVSDPTTGTFAAYSAASLVMTPLVLMTSARHFTAIPRHWITFAAVGLFAMLTSLTHGIAYTLAFASYVEAVKQVEIIFAMAVGVLIFGESERVREIAPGAAVMLLGMVLLALAS
jgi:drug/metabolite transporter (DMT)-like permease